MTDDLHTVENRLGKALGELASTTAASPEGWDRIEERTAGRGRRRTARWVVAPVLAVALVAVLVAVVLPGGRKDRPSVVAGPAIAKPAGPSARYAPQGLAGYRLDAAGTTGGTAPAPGASRVHVYGLRAPDGLRFDAFVAVVTRSSAEHDSLLRSVAPGALDPSPSCPIPEASCFGDPAREVTLRGQQMTIVGADGGFKVIWVEPGGLTVGVLTHGVMEEAVRTIVENVRVDGGTAVAGAVPEGFLEIYRGTWPPAPATLATYLSQQSWVNDGDVGGAFTLETYEGPGISLDTRAWLVPGAALTSVNGSPALAITDAGEQSLMWQPRPGVLLVLTAHEQNEPDVAVVAESVQELAEEDWRSLVGRPSLRPPDAMAPLPVQGLRIADGTAPGGSWTALLNQYSGRPPAVCIDIRGPAGDAHGCADIEIPATALGRPQLLSFGQDGGGNFLVVPVAESVSAVQFVQWDGTTAMLPPMRRAGVGFEIVVIPLGSATPPDGLVAIGFDGRELERRDLPATLTPPADVQPPPAVAPPIPAPPEPRPPGG